MLRLRLTMKIVLTGDDNEVSENNSDYNDKGENNKNLKS